jgi:hypothetical protein
MSDLVPEISWETLLVDIETTATPYTYRCKVAYINPNDPGYGQLGNTGTPKTDMFYMVDFAGRIFEIKEVIDEPTGYIEIYDLTEDPIYGPYPDKNAYVYQSKTGRVILTQAQRNRLDRSAIDLIWNTENNVIQTDLINVDYIQFNTNYSPTITPEGKVWWNGDEYTLNLSTGLGPTIQVGQETLLLYYNDTGSDIQNFSVIRPKSATVVSGVIVPTPELAQSNIWSKCEGTLAVATQLIPNGQLGFVVIFGRARDGDTSGFTPGEALWLSATVPGGLTNTEPEFPNFKISMGAALNSATSPDGQIFVSITRDIFDTFNDAWDGSIRETINFTVASDGATITGSLQNQDFPSDDLTLIFSDGFTTYDTTPAATVVLTPGSSTIAQTNYVYIDKATKTLQASTSDWPVTEEHARVAEIAVYTASRTKLEGAYRNQNWNDHIKTLSDNGHILHLAEAIREKIPATHKSGTEGSMVFGAGNEAWVKVTSGIIKQLHRQSFPSIDMTQYVIDAVSTGSKTFTISDDGDLSSVFFNGKFINIHGSTGNDGLYSVVSTSYSAPNFIITVNETIPSAVVDGTIGDDIHVVNDFTTPNVTVNDLKNITTDASGGTLVNRAFSIVVAGIANKTGTPSHIVANMPTNTFQKNSPDSAVSDPFNYAVYSFPTVVNGVLFLIARFTIIDNSGVWSVYDTEDLRGYISNTTAGGGAGGTGVTTYLGLTDTPSANTGQAYKLVGVNAAETGHEYVSDIKVDSINEWTTSAGINLGTNTLFIDQDNSNVGVDDLTPQEKVDINGGLLIKGTSVSTTTTGALGLKLGMISTTVTSDTEAYVVSQNTGGPAGFAGDLLLIPRTSIGGNIRMLAGNGTPIERLTILGTGEVGINDNTPSYKLDVNGTGRYTGILYGDSGFRTGASNSSLSLIARSGGASALYAQQVDGTGTIASFRYGSATAGGGTQVLGVTNAGIQVTGLGTFSQFPTGPSAAPTTDYQLANKKYVDDNAGSSPLTTKGDLYTYSTLDARLPVGTDGHILTADSSETTGLKWASPSNGYSVTGSLHLSSTDEDTVFDALKSYIPNNTDEMLLFGIITIGAVILTVNRAIRVSSTEIRAYGANQNGILQTATITDADTTTINGISVSW